MRVRTLHSFLVKAVSVAVVCLFMANDIAYGRALHTYRVQERATLAPPLASNPPCRIIQMPDGTFDIVTDDMRDELRKRWVLLDIIYLAGEMLGFAREYNLERPSAILRDLVKKHIFTAAGDESGLFEELGVSSIEEIREKGEVTSFLVSFDLYGETAFRVTISVDTDSKAPANEFKLPDGTKIIVDIENLLSPHAHYISSVGEKVFRREMSLEARKKRVTSASGKGIRLHEKRAGEGMLFMGIKPGKEGRRGGFSFLRHSGYMYDPGREASNARSYLGNLDEANIYGHFNEDDAVIVGINSRVFNEMARRGAAGIEKVEDIGFNYPFIAETVPLEYVDVVLVTKKTAERHKDLFEKNDPTYLESLLISKVRVIEFNDEDMARAQLDGYKNPFTYTFRRKVADGTFRESVYHKTRPSPERTSPEGATSIRSNDGTVRGSFTLSSYDITDAEMDRLLGDSGMQKDQVVKQVVFVGSRQRENEIRKRLESYYGTIPATSFVYQPPLGGAIAVETVAETDPEAKIIRKNKNLTVVEKRGVKEGYLAGIRPKWWDRDPYKQIQRAFREARILLEGAGFDFAENVKRIWLYQNDITGNYLYFSERYQRLNDGRDVFFTEQGMRGRGWYPASTGIGMSDGSMLLECLAIRGEEVPVQFKPLENPESTNAHEYDKENVLKKGVHRTSKPPLFSRGMAVIRDGHTRIYISGTASVKGPHVVHKGDVEKQTLTTIENISLVLEQGGAGLKDVTQIRIYVKNPEDYLKVRAIVEASFPHAPPAVYLHAGVCRDEWLVEIEVIADKISSSRQSDSDLIEFREVAGIHAPGRLSGMEMQTDRGKISPAGSAKGHMSAFRGKGVMKVLFSGAVAVFSFCRDVSGLMLKWWEDQQRLGIIPRGYSLPGIPGMSSLGEHIFMSPDKGPDMRIYGRIPGYPGHDQGKRKSPSLSRQMLENIVAEGIFDSTIKEYEDKLREYEDIVREKRVLDLGTQLGPMACWARGAGALEITGIDKNPAAIDMARKLSRERGHEVIFLESDVTGIKRVGKGFGAVTAGLFWEFLSEKSRKRALKDCFEILSPGGNVLFLVSNAHPYILNKDGIVVPGRTSLVSPDQRVWSHDEWKKNLEEAGFGKISVRYLWERETAGQGAESMMSVVTAEKPYDREFGERAAIAVRSLSHGAFTDPAGYLQGIVGGMGVVDIITGARVDTGPIFRESVRFSDRIDALIKDVSKTSREKDPTTGQAMKWESELRTLLEDCRGMAQLLSPVLSEWQDKKKLFTAEDSAEVDEILEEAAGYISAITAILENRLRFLRGETEKQEYDLAVLIEEINDKIFHSNSNVAFFKKTSQDETIVVDIDKISLLNSISNMLKNAEQASGETEENRIVISLEREGSDAVVTIADNGPGISPRVLEPGRDGRPGFAELNFTTKPDGTGLGSAESWHTVRDHGGSIEVISKEGKGTKFVLKLPASTEAAKVLDKGRGDAEHDKERVETEPSIPGAGTQISGGEHTKSLPFPAEEKAISSDREVAHAQDFRTTMGYIQAKFSVITGPAGELASSNIIAVGTSWLKGYEKGAHLQYEALNPLLTAIANYCGRRNIPFILAADEDLPGLIAREKIERGMAPDAKAIMLVGADVERGLDSCFEKMARDNNYTVIGIDSSEMSFSCYIRIMEILTIAMKLSIGVTPELDNENMKIIPPARDNPVYIIVPYASPMEYEKLKHIYDVQRFA